MGAFVFASQGRCINSNDIVLEIDAEISRLRQARALLSDTNTTVKRKPGRPASTSLPSNTKVVHTMSAETRAKMAAAQKARWAKAKKAAKKAARKVAAAPAVKSATPQRRSPKDCSCQEGRLREKGCSGKVEKSHYSCFVAF